MKNWMILCFCSLVLVVTNVVAASVEYETVQATGLANRADKALSKALANAVSQVNGAQAMQTMDIRETRDRVYMGWYGSTVEIPSKEINVGYTKTYSGGSVRSYKVLKTEFSKQSGDYTIHIEATVQKVGEYANIGTDRSPLVPLAVAPLATLRTSYEGLDGTESGPELSERLSSLLSDELSRSNQFRVLDRANLPVALTEQLITQSLGAKTGQQVKFKQSLSADLIVVGQVREFSVRSEAIKSYGSTFPQYQSEIVMDIRVIEMATQEVRFSKRFERYLDHDQIDAQLKSFNKSIFSDANNIEERRTQRRIEGLLMAEASDEIVKAFHPNYVPRRVQLLEAEAEDESTKASDTPGSSDRPLSWN